MGSVLYGLAEHAAVLQAGATPVPVATDTDTDTAGRAAAVAAWRLLVDADVTDPRGVTLTGKDPADVVKLGGTSALRAVLGTTTPLIATVPPMRAPTST